jgi:hypothetical protein
MGNHIGHLGCSMQRGPMGHIIFNQKRGVGKITGNIGNIKTILNNNHQRRALKQMRGFGGIKNNRK